MYKLTRRILSGMVLVLTCSTSLFAQQIPLTSGYMFDSFQINPAYAGFKDSVRVTSMLSKQFSGIQRSPQSAYFGLDMAVANKPVGLGLQIIDDRQYITKNFGAQVAYSYRIKTGINTSLSMGLQAGVFSYNIDYTKVDIIDANDPLFSQDVSKVKLNVGTGVFFNAPRFYVGLSSPNLVQNNRKNNPLAQENDVNQELQVYLNTGYIIAVNEMLIIKPSILLRAVNRGRFSFDVNAIVSTGEKLSFGISYRDQSSIVGMFDLKILSNLNLGYVYGYNTTKFTTITNGAHEFILRYAIPFKKKV